MDFFFHIHLTKEMLETYKLKLLYLHVKLVHFLFAFSSSSDRGIRMFTA